MAVFPREVCYHSDPSQVYETIAWSAKDKLYTLINDAGEKYLAGPDEFTILSSCREPLIKSDGKGGFIVDESITNSVEKAVQGEKKKAGRGERPLRRRASLLVEKAVQGGQEEAKTAVREALSLCEGREDVAKVAGKMLGEDWQDLMKKYESQDNGRFRMILGNRMRGHLKKQE